jgi:ribokinase
VRSLSTSVTVRLVTPSSLCVLGDYAWDVLIRTNSELLRGGDTFGEVVLLPGGSAANVAVWAARAGTAVTFVGKIGRDQMGMLAREELVREGVEHRLIETDAHVTGSVAVFVDHTGERSMVSGHGADFYLLPSELPRPSIVGASHLHLTAWSFFTDPPRSAAREAARLAKNSGATISFDPGSFQMIGDMGVETFLEVSTDIGVDVFLPNKEEAAVLTGSSEPEVAAERLSRLFDGALIVMKLDADGALVCENGLMHRVPPTSNRLVDATGAGDSFAGAFLSRWLKGTDSVDAAGFAVGVAEWVIEHPGARPAPDAALSAVLARP